MEKMNNQEIKFLIDMLNYELTKGELLSNYALLQITNIKEKLEYEIHNN